MFQPYAPYSTKEDSQQPHDIAVVFAHATVTAGGKRHIYALGALRLSADGEESTFSSLVHCTTTRARDFLHSRITKKMLATAPPLAEAGESLREFLKGVPYAFMLDTAGAEKDLAELCAPMRLVDAGFMLDYFMPWAATASLRQIWETIHNRQREKVSFTAEEGARTGIDCLRFIGGMVLDESRYPAARAIRFHLRASNTLFGDACLYLLKHYTDYFGGLVAPVVKENTPNWQQFLESAPKVPPKENTVTPFTPLPQDDMRQLYEELAHKRKGYRVRDPQVTYAGHVAKALNAGAVSCIEAGTGTGKTLGYLLPVMEFLKRNPEARVAIATYTKSLQDQLFGNELDTCRELFGQYRDIPVALVKGKGNYVCARKLDDLHETTMQGKELLAWLYFVNICFRYRQADCEDISPRVRRILDDERQLSLILHEVSAGSGCHSSHNQCPAQVVTAEAASSRLVITNHNKLILMEKDGKLGGLFKHVVIDEANHFEEAVRKASSPEVSSSDVFNQTRYLRDMCRKLLREPTLHAEDNAGATKTLAASAELIGFMDDMRERFIAMDAAALGGLTSLQRAHRAFTDGDAGNDIETLHKLVEAVYEASALFTGKKAKRLPLHFKAISRARTMRMLLHETMESLHWLRRYLDHDGAWQAVQVFQRGWMLGGGLVYVGHQVRNWIISQRDTVVLTSATLTHRGSFDPFRRSLGLGKGPEIVFDDEIPPKPCFVTRVAPPFTPDYTIVVPSDAPPAQFDKKDRWLEYVIESLPRLIEANHGATLVLCASYDDLERIEAALEANYDSEYPLLFQKRGEPAVALCDEFRAAKESVLFGVETFWHGVDFPGDTLTQVIITRLPYPSPGAPLMEARKRYLPENGYWERQRYETAIKFRQGSGRLIRRESDSGRVVVLDNRILKQRTLAPVDVQEVSMDTLCKPRR